MKNNTVYDALDEIRLLMSESNSMSLAAVKSRYMDWIRRNPTSDESLDSSTPPLLLFGDWMARKAGLTHELDDRTWDRLPIDHWEVASELTDNESDACARLFDLMNEYKHLSFQVCSRERLHDRVIPEGTSELPLEAIVARLSPEEGYYLFVVVSSANVPSGSYRRFQFFSRDLGTVSDFIANLRNTVLDSEQ